MNELLRSAPLRSDHVLVVEDDPGTRSLIVRILRENGLRATGVGDGREMWDSIEAAPVDLLILDVMLPGADGLDLCRAFRARSPVPIIMVSARGEEMDRVLGLEVGADDYISKPFGRRELLARVRAALRRGAALEPFPGRSHREMLRFAGWALDRRRRRLTDPGGAEVELSGAEHDLLVSFLEHPQRVIGRERLLELSRSRLGSPSDRSIDVLVSRLRRKLGSSGPDGALIRTIRGIGYMFTADVEHR
ncbi:response regulator transcription factor [Inquilinus sp. Marseille-Q2685]|uniref:response regulator transcription factor n=1 Tax=Inquilinus sp. Marseille-Q2685 TaxID=2866581 RepID=UPI001CE3C99E|nr:response regulator transcription factor [Inquilinus sp. Marseille-Q2685]